MGHGDGSQKYRNGSQYTGKFVTGVKHGHGRYLSSINTNHKVLEGEWENDTFQGKTIEEWEVALESFHSKTQGKSSTTSTLPVLSISKDNENSSPISSSSSSSPSLSYS